MSFSTESFLFSNLSVAKFIREQIDIRGITQKQYEILLAMYVISKIKTYETMKKKTLIRFVDTYVNSDGYIRYDQILDELHEKGFVYIDTLDKVSITPSGIGEIDIIYNRAKEYYSTTLKKSRRAITEGNVSVDGLLQSISESKPTRRLHTNPYLGVTRDYYHKWNANVKLPNKKVVHIGRFETSIEAAKARDKYIEENNLRTKRSLP